MSLCPVELFLDLLPSLSNDEDEVISNSAEDIISFLDNHSHEVDIHDVILGSASRLLLEIREYTMTDDPYPLCMELDLILDFLKDALKEQNKPRIVSESDTNSGSSNNQSN